MTDTTNTLPPFPEHPWGQQDLTWTTEERQSIEQYGDARAAHAVAQMQGEPVAAGWKLVPVEPNEGMAYAGLSWCTFPERVYRAMLNAAPPAPAAENPTTSDSPEYTAGWKAGYKHGAWGEKREGLTDEQLVAEYANLTPGTTPMEAFFSGARFAEDFHGITPADAKEVE